MTETTNYQLNQWEADDRVQRVDFNADNARIEAALSDLEARVALLDRLAAKLTFHTGRLALSNVEQTKMAFFTGSSINEQFLYNEGLTFTGGVTFKTGMVVLEGSGKTGSVTSSAYSVPDTKWSQAIMWVEYSAGGIVPKVNGTPLEPGRSFRDIGSDGHFHTYQQFTCTDLPPKPSANVALELDTQNYGQIKVYAFSIIFF